MYEERLYRVRQNTQRFKYFDAVYLETDLFIGIPVKAEVPVIRKTAISLIKELRHTMDQFINANKGFEAALEPIKCMEPIPKVVHGLLKASEIANVGPMAGIAGLFSSQIGNHLMQEFDLDEIVVENGGDIYCQLNAEANIAIYAGSSPLSDKIALKIPPGEWGICTSSGTIGHSLSFGKADALVVVSKNTVLADALATALGNKVSSEEDLLPTVESITNYPEVGCLLAIIQDKIAIKGNVEMMFV